MRRVRATARRAHSAWGVHAPSRKHDFLFFNTLHGHIESQCLLLEKPRNAAHHLIWREILIQLKAASASGDTPDDEISRKEGNTSLEESDTRKHGNHEITEGRMETTEDESTTTIVYTVL